MHYDRIDISQGIVVNKTSASRECNICQYWYYLDKGFKFLSYTYLYSHIKWENK